MLATAAHASQINGVERRENDAFSSAFFIHSSGATSTEWLP